MPRLEPDGWTQVRCRRFVLRDHPQETTENSVDLGHFAIVHGYRNVRMLRDAVADGPYLSTAFFAEQPLPSLLPWRTIPFEFETHIFGLGYSLVDVRVLRPRLDLRLWVLPTPIDEQRLTLRLAASVRARARSVSADRIADRVLTQIVVSGFAWGAKQDFPDLGAQALPRAAGARARRRPDRPLPPLGAAVLRGRRRTRNGGGLRRPSRRRLIIGLAVLVPLIIVGGLAIAVTTGLLLEDKATPVSIQDVLARFHEGERRTGKLDGVYLYATRGQESVDALGGATHRYPKSTTITLVTVPCGMRLLWEPFEERSVRWTLCATGDGIELADWEVAHEFFGQGDRTGYTCTESVLVPAEEKSGASPFRCRSDQGRQDGETEMLGVEQVAVGNARRAGVHVRTVGQVTGGDSGTETDGLVARRAQRPAAEDPAPEPHGSEGPHRQGELLRGRRPAAALDEAAALTS